MNPLHGSAGLNSLHGPADDEEELGPIVAARVVRGGLVASGMFAACIAWTLVAAPVDPAADSTVRLPVKDAARATS